MRAVPLAVLIMVGCTPVPKESRANRGADARGASPTASLSWEGASDTLTTDVGQRDLGVATAGGDFDGDGYADLAAAAYGAGDGGRVFVYLGSASGLSTEEASMFGAPAGDGVFFGSRVRNAGDVNGDGRDDLLVGDDWTEYAYLYLASASGIETTPEITMSLGIDDGCLGGVGDLDADGYDEFAVCRRVSGGYYYIDVYEGASTVSSTPALSLSRSSTEPYSVSGGDVDGDGDRDLVFTDTSPSVYLNGSSGLATTSTYLYYYASYMEGATPAADFNGDGIADLAGRTSTSTPIYVGSSSGVMTIKTTLSVRGDMSVGDIDADGYDDLLVTDKTTASVYYGSSSGLSALSVDSWTLSSNSLYSGAILGDADGDGYGETVLGRASDYQLLAYEGSASGTSTTAFATVTGRYPPYFGSTVAGLGDVDGDGLRDFAVSAPTFGTVSAHYGVVYVYLGNEDGDFADPVSTISGTSAWPILSVTAAGDVDGDGHADVLVKGGSSTSTYYFKLFLGSASGVSTTAASTSGLVYSALPVTGDVNHDGYGDVADVSNISGSTYGVKYYLGSATGYGTATTVISSTPAGSRLALADVDGDTYADLVVGDSSASSSAGTLKVYPGSSSGLKTTASTSWTGASSTRIGSYVASVGDVTDDGYDDLIVTSTKGTVVYYGTSSGLNSAVSTSFTSVGTTTFAVGLGDIDGDGIGDAAINYDSAVAYDGAAIFTGTTGGFGSSPTWTEEADNGSAFGYAIAGLGDINGDDSADFLVGAGSQDSGDGYAQLYYGIGDKDGDGFTSADDCDDTDPDISPDGTEVCDGSNADEDCDGDTDDADSSVDTTTMSTFYADTDGDGYGGATSASACDASSGWVATSTDCDDSRGDVHPGGSEVCDAADADEDCDGATDDADTSVSTSGMSTFYQDGDGDGYGGTSTSIACDRPSGYLATSSDCDDSKAAVHPGATEVCDASDVDDDCDGKSDDDDSDVSSATMSTFYHDADGDGYGGSTKVFACDLPAGATESSLDCDDSDARWNPRATEVCGGVDEDCDGLRDDADPSVDLATATQWYADDDHDGFGSGLVGTSCVAPAGSASASGDCDDSSSAIWPGASEVPTDGIDQDCEGHDSCWQDADGDGYHNGGIVVSLDADCSDSGEADADARRSDCDDANRAVHPDAVEADCDDLTDYNCDGATGLVDGDRDGFPACEDCDDGEPSRNPGAAEICDDLDQDCDGSIDEDPAVGLAWGADADGDGFTDDATRTVACEAPDGLVALTEPDCDDADAGAHPGGTEVPGDLADSDCDGDELCFLDADGDGWRADDVTTVESADLACDGPAEAAASAPVGDCDDRNPDASPDATEVPGDGVDQDCDGDDLEAPRKGCATTPMPASIGVLLMALAWTRRSRSIRPVRLRLHV